MSLVECYGAIFGVGLSYDSVHDEVCLADTGLVVMVNGVWCFSGDELFELCRVYRREGFV